MIYIYHNIIYVPRIDVSDLVIHKKVS